MTSKTFSNWIVLKSTLKRLKWFGILYAIAIFLELPLLLWMDLSRQKFTQGALWVADKSFQPQMLFHPFAHLTNMAVAVIFGLIIFYYLHQERANIFFHSLPLKRTMLYVQNLLAGLILLWVPLLLNGITSWVVLARFGIKKPQWFAGEMYDSMGQLVNNAGNASIETWKLMAYWLLINFLMTGLFLIFTVFIGMLTGNTLLQASLTVIGLFLPLGLYLLVQYNFLQLLYGFPREVSNRTIEGLSPIVGYLTDSNFRFQTGQSTWYWIYLVATVILIALSLYLYKKRHAEAAGETLASEWMRWVFKYGVAFCSAMMGGLYLNAMNENMGALFTGYAIGGVLGYIISDMIAHKSFHFYRRWKGMLVSALVFALLVSVVNLDLFGYEKFVPNQENIKEVKLGNLSGDGYMAMRPGDEARGLRSEKNIELVRQLQKKIIELKAENETLEEVARRNPPGQPKADQPLVRMMPLEFTYTLENGSLVRRSYTVDIYKYRTYLAAIYNTEEHKKSAYRYLFELDKGKLDQLNINNHHLGKNIRIYKKDEVEKALTALEKDILNLSYEAAVEGRRPVKGQIEFAMKAEPGQGQNFFNLSYHMEFANFDAFLKEYGYYKELFIEPSEVEKIVIKKTDSTETAEVLNKEDIELLLYWSNRDDEKSFQMRGEKAPEWVHYYGDVVKKDGTKFFVSFDSSDYSLRLLQKFFKQ